MNRWICMIIFMIWSNDNDYSDYWWRFFFLIYIFKLLYYSSPIVTRTSRTPFGVKAGRLGRVEDGSQTFTAQLAVTHVDHLRCVHWKLGGHRKHTHLRLYGIGTLVHVKRTWKRTWKPIRVKCMDFRPVSRTAVNLVISVNLSTLKKESLQRDE